MARSQIRQPQKPPIDAWGAGRLGLIFSLLYRFGPPRWSQYVRKHWAGQRLVIGVPYLWLFLFFAVPFIIVLKLSFSEVRLAMPPYAPLIEKVGDAAYALNVNLGNYAFLLSDPLYTSSYLYSVKVAAISTLFCLLVGYPMAYAIARSTPTLRNIWLMLIILPFWTSFLIRVYAWIGILKNNGLLNNFLISLGLIDEPLTILHTPLAVYIGIVYSYLPFMVLPLYATLSRLDLTLLEAAADLGCRPWRAFVRVTLPLSLSGILAGSLLVFIPAVGEFVIPDLLGGPDSLMVGRMLWTEFFSNKDWPLASALALVLLAVLVVPFVALQRWQSSLERES
jgi:putrescine transport system permease protein